MTAGAIVAAGLMAALAAAHSGLGETGFIRPLLAAEWSLTEIPRWAAERLARGAWHLTSVAWLGLAAIALGAPPLASVGAVAVASAGLMFLALRPHFAWPLFLVAGLAGLRADAALPDPVIVGAAALTALILLGAAGLHVYWALGGRTWVESVIPADDSGDAEFRPPPALTLLVAGALITLAALVTAKAGGVEHGLLTAALVAAAAILGLRAVGDGRQVGFSKQNRDTRFAQADDRIFTPLVTLLAVGTSLTLVL